MFKPSLKLIACLLLPCYAAAVEVAITIDDYPMADGCLFSNLKRTSLFIRALANHQTKAAFFCIGKNCQNSASNSLLKKLSQHGHFLANHTLTHEHLSGLTLEEFESELMQTDALLAPYKNTKKWFRYPYLDYGERKPLGGSNEKAKEGLKKLQQWGYTEGYVTINTFDWYLDAKLAEALQKGYFINYPVLKTVYLSLLKQWCQYYITLYSSLFDLPITHTLLLHANDLNALYLGDILEMIKKAGWQVVSPEKAFEDVSWRENIAEGLELITHKPPSLSCAAVDKILAQENVFLPAKKTGAKAESVFLDYINRSGSSWLKKCVTQGFMGLRDH